MPERPPRLTRRLVTVAMAAALVVTACGGGGGEIDPLAAAAAEVSQQLIDVSGDIATTQLIDTGSGEIASLADVVTGDRAVLVWYWAPH